MIAIKSLNEVRIQKSLTLKEIAQKLGVSECYCSLLLSGKRRMSLDNAERLANALGISIDEVFIYYNFSKSKKGVC